MGDAPLDIPDLPDALRLVQATAAAIAARVPGWTALHSAAELGHVAALEFLLENGVPVESATATRSTPLHVAARAGRLACARALLAAGADAHATDAQGCTPHDLAVRAGRSKLAALLAAAVRARSDRRERVDPDTT